MQSFLHTVPLAAADWLYIIVFAAAILVLEEFRKIISRMVGMR